MGSFQSTVRDVAVQENRPRFKKRKANTPLSHGDGKRRCLKVEMVNEQKDVEPAPITSSLFVDCPICLEALEVSNMSATTCGHVFCSKCIRKAVHMHHKCPTCRTDLTIEEIHPLYL